MPSKDTRFKKGKSGNPKGRPKSKASPDIFLEEFVSEINEVIAVSIDGRTQKMSVLRALLKQLLAKAASGDVPAIKEVLNRLIGVLAALSSAEPKDTYNFNDHDREVINYVYSELTAEAGPATSEPAARDVEPDGQYSSEPRGERDADAWSEDEGSVSN